MTRTPTRFWFYLEATLAFLSAAAAALVLWRPDWIEALLGTDPDTHSGALEKALAIGLATAALPLASAAWRQRQRIRAIPATDRSHST
jgi:hypothetical protein